MTDRPQTLDAQPAVQVTEVLAAVARALCDMDQAEWGHPPVTDETWPALAAHYRRKAAALAPPNDGPCAVARPAQRGGAGTSEGADDA